MLWGLAHFYNGTNRRCNPSHESLAKVTGASLRSVAKFLNRLRDRGAISWKGNRTGGKQVSNLYKLVFLPSEGVKKLTAHGASVTPHSAQTNKERNKERNNAREHDQGNEGLAGQWERAGHVASMGQRWRNPETGEIHPASDWGEHSNCLGAGKHTHVVMRQRQRTLHTPAPAPVIPDAQPWATAPSPQARPTQGDDSPAPTTSEANGSSRLPV